jgi:hypothetical protein
VAAGKPPAKAARSPKLNFKLELHCACKPPICSHAGPGIAKLLEAAYAKGRADGMGSAIQGITKAAAKIGVTVEVQRTPSGVRQKGSKRTH